MHACLCWRPSGLLPRMAALHSSLLSTSTNSKPTRWTRERNMAGATKSHAPACEELAPVRRWGGRQRHCPGQPQLLVMIFRAIVRFTIRRLNQPPQYRRTRCAQNAITARTQPSTAPEIRHAKNPPMAKRAWFFLIPVTSGMQPNNRPIIVPITIPI